MKRIKMSATIIAMILTLSLGTAGIVTGTGYPPLAGVIDPAIEAAGLVETTSERDLVNVGPIFLNKEELDLFVGEFAGLTFTIAPENADENSVTWSSSDPTVARVYTNGMVTALSPGTAIITVTTGDGSHTAICTVTVKSITGGSQFLWIGLGALAPLGTGTGLYFWRKNKKKK